MQWLRRLFRREAPAIPDTLWRRCLHRLPFLDRLSPDELNRLKQLSETLLDRKTFTGVGGLTLTDDIAVLIAAQAALPILNLSLDFYRDMAGVIVYPTSFIVPQSEMDEAGVMHEWEAPVAGEALEAGGAVALSWEDVADIDSPGFNVVIHEFAHKIDMGDGMANGCPPFFAAYHEGIRAQEWQRVFSAAYRDFSQRVDDIERNLPEGFDAEEEEHADLYDELCADLPLDPYAASHPSEFFAVASEAFFVLPQPLAAAYPEAYRLLSLYFRQDPLLGRRVAKRKRSGKHL
jgi:Mlc titration factor MtfA (ptsG expression regulator)